MEPHLSDTGTPETAAPDTGAGAERLDPLLAYGLVALIAAGLVAAFSLASSRATASRAPATGPDLEIVDANGTDQLHGAWRQERVHGAVLVDASATLRYAAVQYGQDVTVTPEYPVAVVDLADEMTKRLDRPNSLFVAAKTGMFRSIHHLMPRKTFAARVSLGRKLGLPGIAEDGRSVKADHEGVPRRIAPDLPAIPEPVVLNVDASYFVDGDADELMKALQSARLDYRLITLDRAREDTQVTPAARKKMDAFEERLMESLR